MMQGYPISAKLPEDLGIGERFWYWRGASGTSYIHSIYSCGSCPPLPGAIFIVVQNTGGHRQPVAVGRFPSFVDGPSERLTGRVLDEHDCNEIHVHLLARDAHSADCVLHDLELALFEDEEQVDLYSGFSEVAQSLALPA